MFCPWLELAIVFLAVFDVVPVVLAEEVPWVFACEFFPAFPFEACPLPVAFFLLHNL